ncbi:MAG TPA: hypothetical protein VI248_23395 [Kineosporiaceae bacterium]
MLGTTIHPGVAPTLANAFGTATLLVAAGYSLPQLVRLRRGSAAGVSTAGAVNTAISFVAWTGYAVWAADRWLLAASLVGLPGAVATAGLAVRHRAAPGRWRLPAIWTATLVAAVVAQAVGLLPMVPLVIGTSIVWTVAPALASAWRSRDVSGIAVGTWLVHAGEGLLYLGYGHLHRQPAATAYGVACLAGSIGVLARLAVARWLDAWPHLQPEPVA